MNQAQLVDRYFASVDVQNALQKITAGTIGFDEVELDALRLRLAACNDQDNLFQLTDAQMADGTRKDLFGNFWRCNSKLCPHCIARRARQNRKQLREALSRQKLRNGERFYFPTLTIINPNLPLRQTRELINYAWSLFRKRSFCRDLVRGGCKSEEFTVTANGYHYHIHLLLKAKFILFNEFRRVWTECVESAYVKFNVPFNVQTKDQMLWVRFETIRDRESLVFELCKYITKSDSWSKIPKADLHEIALIRRWHRMFELFGSFRDSGNARDAEHILDKRSFSDGGKSADATRYWRDRVHRVGIEHYAQQLVIEIAETRRVRMRELMILYPDATLEIGIPNLDEP